MEDITKNKTHLRGLELAVNSVKKKFSFIKGWKLNESYEKYEAVIYVDFYIDIEQLSNDVKYPISRYFKQFIDNKEYNSIKSSSLGVFFDVVDCPEGQYEQCYEEKFQYFYAIKKSLNDRLDESYNMLPEEFKITFKSLSTDITATPLSDDFLDYRLF